MAILATKCLIMPNLLRELAYVVRPTIDEGQEPSYMKMPEKSRAVMADRDIA